MSIDDMEKNERNLVESFELYSDEIQELIGRSNRKFEILFMFMLFCVCTGVVLCGILIECPDYVTLKAVVKNDAQIEKIVCPHTVVVSDVFVDNGDSVYVNSAIALIGNGDTIRSDQDGRVYYIGYDRDEEIFQEGTPLFAVVSKKSNKPEGRFFVPSLYIGKVMEETKCSVCLDAFASEDYGSMEGIIDCITPFPVDGVNYMATVRFPDSWKTSTGKYVNADMNQYTGNTTIVVGKKCMAEIILEPMMKYFRGSRLEK